MSMSNLEIGSVVYNMISNIPVGISGLLANGILVNNNVYFAEQVTGNTIGITSIDDIYLAGIISLTCANVMELMEAQGMGARSVSIGELSLSKGMVEGTSRSLKEDGMNKLKAIGERISSYQVWG